MKVAPFLPLLILTVSCFFAVSCLGLSFNDSHSGKGSEAFVLLQTYGAVTRLGLHLKKQRYVNKPN